MNRTTIACALLCAATLSGCASTPSAQRASDQTTARSSPAAVAGPDSLADGRYTLVVHGMSCPKCISNVELQLSRIRGVVRPVIDMKHGFVRIEVEGGAEPSKADLTEAVMDSGFTLVEIRGGER